METLCEYIILNVDYNMDEEINYKKINFDDFYDLDNYIDIISECLNINKDDITINNDNLYIQRAIILSFNFKDRQCHFYKEYGTRIDYLCVSMMPI